MSRQAGALRCGWCRRYYSATKVKGIWRCDWCKRHLPAKAVVIGRA